MATIFEDNFNSYNDGNLVGQGNWTNIADGAAYQIQGTTVKEGTKAVKKDSYGTGFPRIYKMGNSLSAGKQTLYVRKTATNTYFMVMLEYYTNFTGVIIRFDSDGDIKYFNGAAYVAIQAYSANQWYCVEVEWINDAGTKKARYRVDGGNWTDYYAMNGNPANLDSVRVYAQATDVTYFDHIAEEPYTVTGTNMKINVGDVFKDVSAISVNVGDVWKSVTAARLNIGDLWKTIF